MDAPVWRRTWLWSLVAILVNGSPGLAVCAVPTVTGSVVRGRAYDLLGSRDQPLGGATVRLLSESGKVAAQAVADQDGRFTISAPAQGRYRLTVTAEGFQEVSAVVVAKQRGKNTPLLRVELGADVMRPCGGGGITVVAPDGSVLAK